MPQRLSLHRPTTNGQNPTLFVAIADLLLQVLGLQFLVNSDADASRLDRCSSQEMGGGTKHLMSLVPLGRFEGIGILKGFVSSSACFAFH